MKRFLALVMVLAGFPLQADVVNGVVTWMSDDPVMPVKQKVGDLVLVEITETSESTYKETTGGSKSTDVNAKLSKWVRLSRERTHNGERGTSTRFLTRLKPGALNEPEIDYESDSAFNNQSNAQRRSTFKEKIMCEILDVRPNDNMYIKGRKEFRDNGNLRILVFSGEISKADLQELGTIPSFRVKNMSLETIEEGERKDNVEKTWLQSFLAFLWPF